jgi:hypothetical protein
MATKLASLVVGVYREFTVGGGSKKEGRLKRMPTLVVELNKEGWRLLVLVLSD